MTNTVAATAPTNPYVALALAVAELGSQIIALLPNYEQRKAEKFHELRTELETENKKPAGIRNDQLCLDLGDELRRYVEDFSALLRQHVTKGLHQS